MKMNRRSILEGIGLLGLGVAGLAFRAPRTAFTGVHIPLSEEGASPCAPAGVSIS